MGSSSEGTVRCLNADFTKEKYGSGGRIWMPLMTSRDLWLQSRPFSFNLLRVFWNPISGSHLLINYIDNFNLTFRKINMSNEIALVVGAGKGWIASLARTLYTDGMKVILAARNVENSKLLEVKLMAHLSSVMQVTLIKSNKCLNKLMISTITLI